ncbi:hypothetical protein C8J56DRAFT_883575 [Mycena floridula]|nr:hypothetical protein C8J56DRAFT_883575 [Mycena floridula]
MLLSTLGLIFVLSALTTPVAAFMSILQRSPAILRWREHQDFEDHVRANSPEAKTSTLPLPRPKSKAMSRSSQKEVTSSSKSSGSTSGAAKKTEGKAKPKIARSAESMAREKERSDIQDDTGQESEASFEEVEGRGFRSGENGTRCKSDSRRPNHRIARERAQLERRSLVSSGSVNDLSHLKYQEVKASGSSSLNTVTRFAVRKKLIKVTYCSEYK